MSERQSWGGADQTGAQCMHAVECVLHAMRAYVHIDIQVPPPRIKCTQLDALFIPRHQIHKPRLAPLALSRLLTPRFAQSTRALTCHAEISVDFSEDDVIFTHQSQQRAEIPPATTRATRNTRCTHTKSHHMRAEKTRSSGTRQTRRSGQNPINADTNMRALHDSIERGA